MRVMLFGSVAVLAACAPAKPERDVAADAAKAALAQARDRSDDTAQSVAAQDARAIVARYFDRIAAKDFEGARALWGNGGADSGGSAADLARTVTIYSRYEPEVGKPTAIRARDGMQYVAVSAKLFVQNRKTGRTADRQGTVMLRRSANENDPDPGKRDWRIWAIDLRVKS